MPKVEITSQGTRYVSIEDLRRHPNVRDTLEFASRMFRELPGPGKRKVSAEGNPETAPQVNATPPIREHGE